MLMISKYVHKGLFAMHGAPRNPILSELEFIEFSELVKF